MRLFGQKVASTTKGDIMGNNAKTTQFLKECMSDALIKLMSQKSVSDITVDEIAASAGVHRSTWFRNFTSKSEAITYKLTTLWFRWADNHNIKIQTRYDISNARDFFLFNYEIREIIVIIYNAKMQTAIFDAFYTVMTPQYGANADECYEARFYSYGLFGLLDEWVKRGFAETPNEMAETFIRLMD